MNYKPFSERFRRSQEGLLVYYPELGIDPGNLRLATWIEEKLVQEIDQLKSELQNRNKFVKQ